jgi:hypothetical protein
VLHELWHEHGKDAGYTFCLAGIRGDEVRFRLSEQAELIWTVVAPSWLDAMTAFYEYMGWGEYQPMSAELDGISYAEKGWE